MKKIVSVVLAALVAASVFAGGSKETSGAVKVGVSVYSTRQGQT